MSWKLYLDDLRVPTGSGWTVARSMREACLFIDLHGVPTDASLDHDLGVYYCRACIFRDTEDPCLSERSGGFECGCTCHETLPTGYDFLKWIAEHDRWPTNKPNVHSANFVGKSNMEHFIESQGPYRR